MLNKKKRAGTRKKPMSKGLKRKTHSAMRWPGWDLEHRTCSKGRSI